MLRHTPAWFCLACALSVEPLPAQTPGLEERPDVVRPTPEPGERDALGHFAAGRIWHRSEHLLQARRELESAARLHPDAAEPRRALLPIYEALGRDDEVVRACREIVALDPADLYTWHVLARQLRDIDRPDEAISALKSGLESPPADDATTRMAMLDDLAKWSEEDGRLAEAEAACRALLPLLPAEETAAGHERVGQLCLKRGDHDGALAAFGMARDADPDRSPRLDRNLAEVWAARGDHLRALRHLDAYLARAEPADMGPYRLKAQWLNALGRHDEAIRWLRTRSAQRPEHVGVRLLLAEQLAARDGYPERREAERLYTVTAERHPSPDAYLGLFRLLRREQRMSEILARIDALWPAEGDDAAPEMAEIGRAMFDALRDDDDLTGELLAAALRDAGFRRGHEYRTWHLLARLADHAGRSEDAERLFREALSRASRRSRVEIYSALFGVLWRVHDPNAVLELADRGLTESSPFATELMFRYNRTVALTELKRYDEALAEADRAIRVAGDGTDLRMRCQRARILSRMGRHDDAVAACEALLATEKAPGRRRDIHYALANIYSANRDTANAERQLRLILELEPNDATAHNDLGYLWADRNVNLAEAERHIRRALELDRADRRGEIGPTEENAAYLDSLGWVLFRRGRLPEARDLLVRAIAMPEGRGDPVVWDHLGDVRYRLGETDAAAECWRTALRLLRQGRRPDHDDRAADVSEKLRQIAEN